MPRAHLVSLAILRCDRWITTKISRSALNTWLHSGMSVDSRARAHALIDGTTKHAPCIVLSLRMRMYVTYVRVTRARGYIAVLSRLYLTRERIRKITSPLVAQRRCPSIRDRAFCKRHIREREHSDLSTTLSFLSFSLFAILFIKLRAYSWDKALTSLQAGRRRWRGWTPLSLFPLRKFYIILEIYGDVIFSFLRLFNAYVICLFPFLPFSLERKEEIINSCLGVFFMYCYVCAYAPPVSALQILKYGIRICMKLYIYM